MIGPLNYLIYVAKEGGQGSDRLYSLRRECARGYTLSGLYLVRTKRLHEKRACPSRTFPKIGYKFNKWHDIIWMQRRSMGGNTLEM